MVADSLVKIEAAKWLPWHAAWRVREGMDARHASSIAEHG